MRLSWSRIRLQCERPGFDPWVGKIPWRKKLQPTPVSLPGKSHGQRTLAGYSPWGCKRVGYNCVTKQHGPNKFKAGLLPKAAGTSWP